MQIRVREVFRCLETEDTNGIPWTIIDASKTIEEVHNDIWEVASATVEASQAKAIGTLFTKKPS
jgi:thymidylate kinase